MWRRRNVILVDERERRMVEKARRFDVEKEIIE
jgi:hypothetical protein